MRKLLTGLCYAQEQPKAEQPKAEQKADAQDGKPQDMETDGNTNSAAPEAAAAPNGDAAAEDPMEH